MGVVPGSAHQHPRLAVQEQAYLLLDVRWVMSVMGTSTIGMLISMTAISGTATLQMAGYTLQMVTGILAPPEGVSARAAAAVEIAAVTVAATASTAITDNMTTVGMPPVNQVTTTLVRNR